jgi:putative heme iron utilization protein
VTLAAPPLHESRLDRALCELLAQVRVAALGTLDAEQRPAVSMVPYALATPDGQSPVLVLHLSGLAAHTTHLQHAPRASLMAMAPEQPGQPVHALPRVTLDVLALPPDAGDPAWRHAYLARFPEAEPMTGLPDFRFVGLQVLGARHIAGFGAARSLDAAALHPVLCAAARTADMPRG